MNVAAHSAGQWSAQLARLLPPGAAWSVPKGGVFDALLWALAGGLADAEASGFGLLDEADPGTAIAVLGDWERVAGLPDVCTGPLESLSERQRALVARLTARGGQSRAYFIAIAAGLGFEVEIEEFRPFTCADACDGAVYDESWVFTWLLAVRSGEFADATWMDALSGCDEALRSFGSGQLECVIARLAPAHTELLISYPGFE